MRYIKNLSTDPCFNLALEQYVFDNFDTAHNYFMLWQNHNSIIVGKHQNTFEEINSEFVNKHGITVVRRLSGGGAVYHDLGNLNFTFISNTPEIESPADGRYLGASDSKGSTFDFALYCAPIADALKELGAPVEISGRNDMTLDGKKFSGNAQYIKDNRVMHHGTLMFDSNLETVARALNVPKDKIESKGIKSVKSRITNIKPFISQNISLVEFWTLIEKYIARRYQVENFSLNADEEREVQKLRREKYAAWEWNYGKSPAFTLKKSRRVEGCGTVQVFLDVRQNAVIHGAEFYGDYFCSSDSMELARLLIGCALKADSLRAALKDMDISCYFANLTLDAFIEILTA